MKRFIFSLFLVGSVLGVKAQMYLTLEESKAMALENNSNIKNSVLELKAARETKREAFTNYFPQVSAGAMGMKAIDPLLEMSMEGGNLPVYNGDPANLAGATQYAYMPDVNMGLFNQLGLGFVNVMQPVFAGNKVQTGNRLAGLNIEVKEKQQKLSENEVLLKTEQQYWQVIVIQEKRKTLDSYLDFLDTLYFQVNSAYQNGIVIKNDLLKIKIKQQELKVNKLQLENGQKLATMAICQTIGLAYSPALVLKGDLDELSAPESYYVPGKSVLPQRAEYQLLEKSVDAARLQTKMQKGNYLPALGIGLSGYYLDPFESGTNGSFNGMAYASLSIPISDWWGGKYKLNELKQKETIARNTLENNKGLLNLQIEKAWTDLEEAYDKIKLTEETLLQTRENLRVNQDSYNNGLIQLSDLLEARALKAETEDKLIEAKSQYKVAITNYLQVTGR
jgi:outer membrane protein TolC